MNCKEKINSVGLPLAPAIQTWRLISINMTNLLFHENSDTCYRLPQGGTFRATRHKSQPLQTYSVGICCFFFFFFLKNMDIGRGWCWLHCPVESRRRQGFSLHYGLLFFTLATSWLKNGYCSPKHQSHTPHANKGRRLKGSCYIYTLSCFFRTEGGPSVPSLCVRQSSWSLLGWSQSRAMTVTKHSTALSDQSWVDLLSVSFSGNMCTWVTFLR